MKYAKYFLVEKRKRQRAEESSNRRKEFQERFPSNGRAKQLNTLNDTGKLDFSASERFFFQLSINLFRSFFPTL